MEQYVRLEVRHGGDTDTHGRGAVFLLWVSKEPNGLKKVRLVAKRLVRCPHGLAVPCGQWRGELSHMWLIGISVILPASLLLSNFLHNFRVWQRPKAAPRVRGAPVRPLPFFAGILEERTRSPKTP